MLPLHRSTSSQRIYSMTPCQPTTSPTTSFLPTRTIYSVYYTPTTHGLQAKATLKCSTQTAVRNILTPSERKVRLKAPWLNFPSIKGDFYVDLLFSKIPSVNGYNGGSLFTNGLGYDRFYPWQRKSEHADALMQFIHDVGVPQTLISEEGPETPVLNIALMLKRQCHIAHGRI
jgi:hypothetical protein